MNLIESDVAHKQTVIKPAFGNKQNKTMQGKHLERF